jgi:hypothetical protein
MSGLLRPHVVSAYQKNKPANWPWQWKAYKFVIWGVTGAAGLTMVFAQEWQGNHQGDHALKGVQQWARSTVEGLITGEIWLPAAAAPASAAAAAAATPAAPAAAVHQPQQKQSGAPLK